MPCGYAVDKEPKYYEETAIYLGYYIMQWGHFLVDFVPRLWLLRQHYHGEKLLVLTSNRKSKINGNYLELLSLFGISEDKIHYVYEPEKYSRIIVPEMSMVRPAYYSEQSQELFHYIVEKAVSAIRHIGSIKGLQIIPGCGKGAGHIHAAGQAGAGGALQTAA